MKLKEVQRQWLGAAVCVLVLSTWVARGGDPTALELIKEGNRFIGEQSKDKVMQIHSDKSVGDLTPNVWFVTYYDPDTTSKYVEVKFGVGRQMGIKRSWRPFGGGGGMEKIMDLTKIKVDSDKAIKTTTAEPLLAKLTIKATQLWLEKQGSTPVWKVRVWVAKLSKADATADVGDLYISAETGEVIKSDLHINKAA